MNILNRVCSLVVLSRCFFLNCSSTVLLLVMHVSILLFYFRIYFTVLILMMRFVLFF